MGSKDCRQNMNFERKPYSSMSSIWTWKLPELGHTIWVQIVGLQINVEDYQVRVNNVFYYVNSRK